MVAIGNELLSGKVRDENLHYLSQRLRALGINLTTALVVRDEIAAIGDALAFARARADVVFTTGGVGPTHDDVTLRALAAAFDVPLRREPELEDRIRAYYGDRVNDEVLSMADVPEGAELIQPAPFFVPIFRLGDVYAFPGDPIALRKLFEPWQETLRGRPFQVARIQLDADEGELAPLLAEVQRSHPEVEIGSYPRYDDGAPYKVLVTVEGRDESTVERVGAELVDRLRAKWGTDSVLAFETNTAGSRPSTGDEEA